MRICECCPGIGVWPIAGDNRQVDIVLARETFGEWEGDLMIFERSQGTMNVASLVERKTRFAVLFRNNDRSSTHFINKPMDVMQPLNPIEQVFSKLKHILRDAAERTKETTWRRIGTLLDHFTSQECTNYLVNAGYASS